MGSKGLPDGILLGDTLGSEDAGAMCVDVMPLNHATFVWDAYDRGT